MMRGVPYERCFFSAHVGFPAEEAGTSPEGRGEACARNNRHSPAAVDRTSGAS